MPKEFDIRNYKNFEEMAFHASTELTPTDLLAVNLIGLNPLLGADTEEDVWNTGGIRSTFSSAETFHLTSASANDTAAGTGARLVKVSGIDSAYNLQTETVTMSGTSNATTTNSYLDIFRLEVVLSGSGQTNAGVITATGSSSSNVAGTITAGEGVSLMSHFTVPAGYTAIVVDKTFSTFRASGTGTKQAEFSLKVYSPTTNTTKLINKVGVSSDDKLTKRGVVRKQIPPMSRIWLSAVAESADTAVSSEVQLLLVNEDLNFRTEL